MLNTALPLTGWLPEKITFLPGQPVCQWFFSGREPFSEPFFDETIARCRTYPENHRRFKPATGLEVFDHWPPPQPAVRPACIIFHVSRCGSTLLSQMLSCMPRHIVLPEVPFFDALLRLPLQQKNITPAMAGNWLRCAVEWYGQRRAGNETRLFIKTDSWHVFFYEQWRHLYPGVPFIFLYRRPGEVLRSQRRKRGMHAIPGYIEPELFGIDRAAIQWQNADHWLCMVLERYFERFIHIVQNDPLALPVSYHEGMMPVLKRMAGFCGLQFTDEEWLLAENRTRYHGKFPGEAFEEPASNDSWPEELQVSEKLFEQLELIQKRGV